MAGATPSLLGITIVAREYHTNSQLLESSKTPSKSSNKPTSHLTTNTFTSTNADGGVVVVTATSYVPGAAESGATTTRPSGSLQTNAAPLRYGRDNILEAMAAGFVVGGALLV